MKKQKLIIYVLQSAVVLILLLAPWIMYSLAGTSDFQHFFAEPHRWFLSSLAEVVGLVMLYDLLKTINKDMDSK